MRFCILAILALLLSPTVTSARSSGVLFISGTVPMTAEVHLNADMRPQMTATSPEIKSEFTRKGEFNIFRIVAP